MKINIAENIKKLRKERAMTQEQLAEAFGITVGAVSKWESGQSTPELQLIVEIADFFETSVDMLLGYELREGGIDKAAKLIHELALAKRFDEGCAEADKGLQKYPNNFDVVYYSAQLYSLRGIEEKSKKCFHKALELYKKAVSMFSLNKNEKIGEITLKNRIAEMYMLLGDTEKALTQLKANNFEGINDCYIGYILAKESHKPEEALGYLASSLTNIITELVRDANGYSQAYEDLKDYASAREITQWMSDVLAGLTLQDTPGYIDRCRVMMLASCAQYDIMLHDKEKALSHLASAKAVAERFDANPNFSIAAMRYYHGCKPGSAYDDFGKTTIEGIVKTIDENEETRDEIRKLWDSLN